MSTTDWILIVYAGVTMAALLMLWGNLLVNLFIFRRPPVVSASVLGSPAPLVSVCVPARNEALRIGNLLRSLAAQDYPDFEVIILNDRSEDDTTAVLQAWQNDIPRMRVMAGESLPRGWVGKCWACHQLSREARGHYILFTDADTILHPQCLSSAVQFAQAHDAALTSLWPRQVAGTWSEKLIIPFVYQLLLVFLPHALVNRISHAGLGAANGQFVLFRRSDYDALGGHEAVRNHLVEDVALARATLAAGRKLLNVDGTELVSCRMYHRFADLWEGFTKNLRAAFEKNAGAFVFFGVLQATVLLGAFLSRADSADHQGRGMAFDAAGHSFACANCAHLADARGLCRQVQAIGSVGICASDRANAGLGHCAEFMGSNGHRRSQMEGPHLQAGGLRALPVLRIQSPWEPDHLP
ncbi:glycosyltransferase [Oscillatoria amoena NRMC-F 0135]|nr:glycosyltransferase [Oscillatoria amoena NRMC-F 0135]